MKSIVVYDAGKSRVDDITLRPLNANEVLVKVAWAGICSTDVELFKGHIAYYTENIASYPIVPGHEYSGVVSELGEGVSEYQEGDAVVGQCSIGCGRCDYCKAEKDFICEERVETGVLRKNGAFSEYIIVDRDYLNKLPGNTDIMDACLTEPLAVVLKALRKINPEDQHNILVTGAGPIGNLCAQVLLLKNKNIDVLDINPERLKCLPTGINGLSSVDFKDYDIVIDASGSSELMDQALFASKPEAVILLVGLTGSSIDMNMDAIICSDKTIIGSISSQKRDWQRAIELISSGSLTLDHFKNMVFPMSQYLDALKHSEGGESLKVLMYPDF
jgi:2-desacetyl-2-hydroxyethyl bacteriochlorophyllide A dehydrogenase